jgi:gamma-glutamyltranspeptidase/glutathione hydrolase
MGYGSMGGDAQPQIQAGLFTRHVMFRMPLSEALDRPRWLIGRTWGSPHGNLLMEDGFDDELTDRLDDAGHDVNVLGDRYSEGLGHAGAVVLHPNGSIEAAHDPRADGGAAGV